MSENNPKADDMDAEAEKAATELIDVKSAQDVVDWLRKWTAKAGYKRLNRRLFEHFPKQ